MNEKTELIREADMKCSFTLRIRDEIFRPGRVRVHLPAPINADWLYLGQVLSSTPLFRMISLEDHPQRTVWFDEILEENGPFTVTYAYESAPRVVTPDPEVINKTHQPGNDIPLQTIRDYEAREHCDCNSYTGALADRVTIMDLASEAYLTKTDEAAIERLLGSAHGEFAELKKKPGELIKSIFSACAGVRDIAASQGKSPIKPESRNELLVSLMRSCGIPARWQGGWRLKNGRTVAADWAIVNAAPYGWIYMDAEAAFEAAANGDKESAEFYFGGIDACRIPTASKLGAAHYPAPDHKRSDEKYNLHGEAEFEERGLGAEEFFAETVLGMT